MLRQIIDWLVLGQMLGGVLFVLYLIIHGLLISYKRLLNDVMFTKVRTQDVILLVRHRKEFMEWMKERDQHE